MREPRRCRRRHPRAARCPAARRSGTARRGSARCGRPRRCPCSAPRAWSPRAGSGCRARAPARRSTSARRRSRAPSCAALQVSRASALARVCQQTLDQPRLDVEAPAERDGVDALARRPAGSSAPGSAHVDVAPGRRRTSRAARPSRRARPATSMRHLGARLGQADPQQTGLRRAVRQRAPHQVGSPGRRPRPAPSSGASLLSVAPALLPEARQRHALLVVVPVDAGAQGRRRRRARPGRLRLEERVDPAARGRARERERRAGEELQPRAGAVRVRGPRAEDRVADVRPALVGMAAAPAVQAQLGERVGGRVVADRLRRGGRRRVVRDRRSSSPIGLANVSRTPASSGTTGAAASGRPAVLPPATGVHDSVQRSCSTSAPDQGSSISGVSGCVHSSLMSTSRSLSGNGSPTTTASVPATW